MAVGPLVLTLRECEIAPRAEAEGFFPHVIRLTWDEWTVQRRAHRSILGMLWREIMD